MTKVVTGQHHNPHFARIQSKYRSLCAALNSQPATSSDSFESDDDGGFHIHRKMLRRRHVRKEQKEREERRREEEEQRKKSGESRESTENLSIVWTTDDSTLSLCSAGGAEGAMNSSSCLDKPIATTTPASPYPPQTVAYPLLVPSASGEISGLPYPRTHLPAFSPLRSRKQRETNL